MNVFFFVIQCNVQLGVGACPDNFVNNGMNEAEVMSFRQEGEFTYIRFRKPLMTGDGADIDTPANGDMQIVWAMGILGADGRVTKHNLRQTGECRVLLICKKIVVVQQFLAFLASRILAVYMQ